VLVDHRLQVAALLVLLAERVARQLALLVERLLQLVERRAQLLGHAGLARLRVRGSGSGLGLGLR
jgi:hypothetical protein